jgi:hypothetical protein
MALKQVHVCDLPNCMNLAYKRCGVCNADVCDRHIDAGLAFGAVLSSAVRENPVAKLHFGTDTVPVCSTCRALLGGPLQFQPDVTTAVEAAFAKYLEVLRAHWAAAALVPPAKPRDPLVYGGPPPPPPTSATTVYPQTPQVPKP